MNKKSVLIVEDHPIVRRGIKQLIDQESEFAVCWEAESTDEALAVFEKESVEFIIVDISLKNSNGLSFIKQIREKNSSTPILVLSMHDENFYSERALKAGANGYTMKSDPPENLIEAMRKIQEGHVYLSESMSKKAIEVFSGKNEENKTAVEGLSKREFEVFQFIGQGYSNREIAENLEISKKTVDTYREKIKAKLGLDSAYRLILYAFKWTQTNRSSFSD